MTYQALALGASTVEIGLVHGAFSLLPAVFAVALGRVVDRGGDVLYLALAMLLYSLGTGWAALAGSLVVLTLTQVVGGIGHILNLVASQTMIANRGPAAQRDNRFGAYFVANSIGQLAGPVVAGVVAGSAALVAGTGALAMAGYDLGDGQRVFWLATASTLVAMALALVLVRRDRRQAPGSRARRPGTRRESIVQAARRTAGGPGMPAAMTVSIIVIAALDVFIAYLPAYGEASGIAVAAVGLLLSVRAGASLVARLFIGRAIGLLGRGRVLVASMVLAGTGIAMLAVASDSWWLLVAAIAIGVGLGLCQPMTISWVADQSPRDERATALGVRITATRVAMLIVPTLMGIVAGSAGIKAIFWVLAIALVAGAGLAARTPFDQLVDLRTERDSPVDG